MTSKKTRGRPFLPSGQAKETTVSLRLKAEERALFQTAADKEGIKLSEWIRKALKSISQGAKILL